VQETMSEAKDESRFLGLIFLVLSIFTVPEKFTKETLI